MMQELVNKIKSTIKNTVFEGHSYIAGGYVRDMVMGISSKDIDIVVDLPDGGRILALFLLDKLNGSCFVEYERFTTYMITVDGVQLEFVTPRTEKYNKNSRMAIVTVGTLLDDVYRRDFTMNSLLYDISNDEILDFTRKGKIDIENKIIRSTTNSDIIFNDDPLRMLRAIRFASKLGFTIEEKTYKGISNNFDRLCIISDERIRDEFVKILISNNPTAGLNMLLDTNLIEFILPELRFAVGLTQNKFHSKDVYGHICDVVSNVEPKPLLRLAALLHDIGKISTRTEVDGQVHFYDHDDVSAKIAERFMKDMKFSNSEIDTVVALVKHHMFFLATPKDNTIRKKMRLLGRELFDDFIKLCEADVKSSTDSKLDVTKRARELMLEPEKVYVKLPVNGQDVMDKFGLKPSFEVGVKLKMAEELFLVNPELTKEELLKMIE